MLMPSDLYNMAKWKETRSSPSHLPPYTSSYPGLILYITRQCYICAHIHRHRIFLFILKIYIFSSGKNWSYANTRYYMDKRHIVRVGLCPLLFPSILYICTASLLYTHPFQSTGWRPVDPVVENRRCRPTRSSCNRTKQHPSCSHLFSGDFLLLLFFIVMISIYSSLSLFLLYPSTFVYQILPTPRGVGSQKEEGFFDTSLVFVINFFLIPKTCRAFFIFQKRKKISCRFFFIVFVWFFFIQILCI